MRATTNKPEALVAFSLLTPPASAIAGDCATLDTDAFPWVFIALSEEPSTGIEIEAADEVVLSPSVEFAAN